MRLWDTATGTPPTTARGHTGYVQALAFAPDGATLASAGLDGTVQGCGTRPPEPRGRSSALPIARPFTRWRSPPTAPCSPPAASAHSPSGTRRRSLAGLASVKEFGLRDQ